MKLFTKEIDKQLFAQYPKGSDLDNQMVVAKIFNPYGRGVWYLLNSDPQDPDYIWAIVDLFEVEMGSVSRSELQTIKLPPFGLGFERDLYFDPRPAKEVFEGLMEGKRYKGGGKLIGNQKKLDLNENGKLDAEDFKMLRGEKMAMGGQAEKAFEVILKNTNGGMTEKAILLAKTKEDASKKAINLKEYKQYGYVVESAEEIKYAMGGKVTFNDKVKAIQKTLLKRKKVAPKVQKDYGKTYNKDEALDSAKRIAGSIRAKYELKKK
jgi:uncharacterized protein (UPF0254 family)